MDRESSPELDPKTPPMFRALCELLTAAGVKLVLHAYPLGGVRSASYIAAPTRGPDDVIELWTLGSITNIDDIADTMNLAHELGHHHVRVAGREPACYRELIRAQDEGEKPMTMWNDEPRETREAVIEVERLAWDEGLNLLTTIGFTDLDGYRKRANESLNGYRKGLGLL